MTSHEKSPQFLGKTNLSEKEMTVAGPAKGLCPRKVAQEAFLDLDLTVNLVPVLTEVLAQTDLCDQDHDHREQNILYYRCRKFADNVCLKSCALISGHFDEGKEAECHCLLVGLSLSVEVHSSHGLVVPYEEDLVLERRVRVLGERDD